MRKREKNKFIGFLSYGPGLVNNAQNTPKISRLRRDFPFFIVRPLRFESGYCITSPARQKKTTKKREISMILKNAFCSRYPRFFSCRKGDFSSDKLPIARSAKFGVSLQQRMMECNTKYDLKSLIFSMNVTLKSSKCSAFGEKSQNLTFFH